MYGPSHPLDRVRQELVELLWRGRPDVCHGLRHPRRPQQLDRGVRESSDSFEHLSSIPVWESGKG